jgi:hypothetical protein
LSPVDNSMSAVPTDTLDELQSLFAWNPPPLKLHPGRQHIGLDTEDAREAAFYDKHFAPDIICKRIVHLTSLQNKVAAVVDKRLLSYDNGIMPPPRSGIISTKLRDNEVEDTENVMKDEMSVVEFYSKTTTRYCVRVASTLALHPEMWSSLLNWSAVPCLGGRDIPGGSLQVLSPRTFDTSDKDGRMVKSRQDLVTADVWRRLMKAKDEYEDLATWRMMSPSAEDTEIMLGVMDMAYSGEFRWNLCPPPITLLANEHAKSRSPQRALDSPDISNLIGIPISSSKPESTQLARATLDGILDVALKRGGSSLEAVHQYDPMFSRPRSRAADDTDETQVSGGQLTTQTLIQEVSRFIEFHDVLRC